MKRILDTELVELSLKSHRNMIRDSYQLGYKKQGLSEITAEISVSEAGKELVFEWTFNMLGIGVCISLVANFHQAQSSSTFFFLG